MQQSGRPADGGTELGRFARTLPRKVGLLLIRVYRYTLSPLIGYDCRHLPTCSHYSEDALGRFGLWAGGWMTLARLCRCHPWGTRGLDFVPVRAPPGARWFAPWRYGRWRGTCDSPEAAGVKDGAADVRTAD
jgi:putative membrane protein insertion efficiency factor